MCWLCWVSLRAWSDTFPVLVRALGQSIGIKSCYIGSRIFQVCFTSWRAFYRTKDGKRRAKLSDRFTERSQTFRSTTSGLPTKYSFTGQRDDGLGLKYYVARHYDAALGRFAQADSDVPESQGVQGLNRYAYVNNAPTRWIDPTGHNADCGIGDQAGCVEGKKIDPPPGTELPTQIKDPRIMQAWVFLYNSTAGRKYAELIRDEKISIELGNNMGNVVARISKTLDPSGKLIIASGTPIQINRALLRGDPTKIVTALAHEAFHYSEPYGQVESSLYEEYRAFDLEDSIWREKNAHLVPSPKDFNPYDKQELTLFFNVHSRVTGSQYNQSGLAAYPSSWEDSGHGR